MRMTHLKSVYSFRGTLFYYQAVEALRLAAQNESQTARADREAMSAGGKDSEAEAFDFSIAVVSLIKRLLFFVGYFIKYGQYRSIKVNHSQLRLIKVN